MITKKYFVNKADLVPQASWGSIHKEDGVIVVLLTSYSKLLVRVARLEAMLALCKNDSTHHGIVTSRLFK